MRNLAGFAVALLSIPLLLWLRQEVAAEWDEANEYRGQIERTTELSECKVIVPIPLFD